MERRENSDRRLLLWFFAVATAVKLLLIPSYRSTDFEVHRNWLAITHSLLFLCCVADTASYKSNVSFWERIVSAYWAPNFWVFYIILDKILAFSLRKLGFEIQIPSASFTGGLVGGDSSPFAVLPQITPLITFAMVLLALTPCLVKARRKPQPGFVARWIAYAYTCGFLFGSHVHEKASLHFTIPLAIVAVQSLEDAKHYFLVSIVSCYSLFPLLYEPQEYPIKVLLLLLHSTVMWIGFTGQYSEDKVQKKENGEMMTKFVIGCIEKSYLMGLVIVEIVSQFLLPYFLGDKFQFIPLMLISTYCAFGISWIWQLRTILT